MMMPNVAVQRTLSKVRCFMFVWSEDLSYLGSFSDLFPTAFLGIIFHLTEGVIVGRFEGYPPTLTGYLGHPNVGHIPGD